MAQQIFEPIRLSKLYSFGCIAPLPQPEVLANEFGRIVFCNEPKKHETEPYKYCTNYVSTTKYSLVTFAPKALFEQFRRVANLYFLLAAIISITPVAPMTPGSIIAPLAFVIGVSMIKEGIEDWRRFRQVWQVHIYLSKL